MYSDRSMFPMMGVGVFNIMFWVGFVVGHNIGLTCSLMLLNSLLFGSVGSYAVVRLERMSKGESRKHKPLPKTRPESRIAPAVYRATGH